MHAFETPGTARLRVRNSAGLVTSRRARPAETTVELEALRDDEATREAIERATRRGERQRGDGRGRREQGLRHRRRLDLVRPHAAGRHPDPLPRGLRARLHDRLGEPRAPGAGSARSQAKSASGDVARRRRRRPPRPVRERRRPRRRRRRRGAHPDRLRRRAPRHGRRARSRRRSSRATSRPTRAGRTSPSRPSPATSASTRSARARSSSSPSRATCGSASGRARGCTSTRTRRAATSPPSSTCRTGRPSTPTGAEARLQVKTVSGDVEIVRAAAVDRLTDEQRPERSLAPPRLPEAVVGGDGQPLRLGGLEPRDPVRRDRHPEGERRSRWRCSARSSSCPFLLFALPAGVWVDRLARRPILVVSDLVRAVALASIPLAYALDALTMWQLYVVGFIVGIGTVFFDVAYQSYLPSLVGRDQLVDGNSKLELSRSSSQVAGPGLAGALIGLLGARRRPCSSTRSASSSRRSSSHGSRRTRSSRRSEERRSMRAELMEGLRFLLGRAAHPRDRVPRRCCSTSSATSPSRSSSSTRSACSTWGRGRSASSSRSATSAAWPPQSSASRISARLGVGPTIDPRRLVLDSR